MSTGAPRSQGAALAKALFPTYVTNGEFDTVMFENQTLAGFWLHGT